MSAFGSLTSIVDKLLERFLPKKAESLRNKIDRLKKEIEAVHNEPRTYDNIMRLERLVDKLSSAEKELQNRAG